MNLIQELLGLKKLAKTPESLSEVRAIVDVDADLSEMIDKFCELNRLHHFEGGRGVNNFEKIARALNPDYRDVDSFLEDNPGCIQAMIEWIGNQNIGEWKESMFAEIEEEQGKPMAESVSPQKVKKLDESVPSGWMLAPLRATPEMIKAGDEVEDLYRRGTPNTWGKVYRAMLEAAPHAPAADK